jgi:hypothetical protein
MIRTEYLRNYNKALVTVGSDQVETYSLSPILYNASLSTR